MWGFSCAPHSDIAHRDNGGTEGTALQDAHLEQQIPDTHAQTIEPSQAQQLIIDFDEIAFQNFLTIHYSLFTIHSHYSLFHTNVVEHTCLHTTIVLEIVANLHEWQIGIAQQLANLTIEV